MAERIAGKSSAGNAAAAVQVGRPSPARPADQAHGRHTVVLLQPTPSWSVLFRWVFLVPKDGFRPAANPMSWSLGPLGSPRPRLRPQRTSQHWGG